MSDKLQLATSIIPAVELTDADFSGSVFGAHELSGAKGSSFEIDVAKFDINLTKEITSTTNQALMTYTTGYDYYSLFVKHTGLDVSGDDTIIPIYISLDKGSTFHAKLSAGQSLLIPLNVLGGIQLTAKIGSAGSVILNVIGNYTT